MESRFLSQYKEKLSNGEPSVWIGQLLNKKELMRKALAVGMHTHGGIPIEGMKNRFGTDPLTYLEKEIGRMCRVGVLEIADGCIRPTKTGRFFSDEISVGFYSFAVKEKLV